MSTTTAILAADDLMTMGNNIKTYVQIVAGLLVGIAGTAFVAYMALKSKFSPTAILIAVVGVIVGTVAVAQLAGWAVAARNSAPGVTGVQNTGTYGMSPPQQPIVVNAQRVTITMAR